MNRIGSVCEWLRSQCSIPEPRLTRSTEQGGSTASAPRLCVLEGSLGHVPDARDVAVRCMGQAAPGTRRSSLNTRSDPNCIHSGSRYSSKEKCQRAWNHPPSFS